MRIASMSIRPRDILEDNDGQFFVEDVMVESGKPGVICYGCLLGKYPVETIRRDYLPWENVTLLYR